MKKVRYRLRLVLAAILSMMGLVSLFLVLGTAQAGGVVTNCTKAGLAAAATSGGTVTFNCGTATISFTSEISLPQDVTIDGGGVITLDAGGSNTRFFHPAYQKSLTLKNITLQNANYSSNNTNDPGGAAVKGEWQSNITLNNVKVLNNNFHSNAGNSGDFGGAIYVAGGVLTVDASTFTNNISYNSGGSAIHAIGANVTIRTSTFTGNQSTGQGNGGAFYNDNVQGSNGFVVIQDSTFTNNTAYAEGGAIRSNLYNGGQSGTFERLTFSGNHVFIASNGYGGYGGAVRIGDGTFTFNNVLFTNNISDNQGGALWTGETVQLTIRNSAMVNNTAKQPGANMGFGGAMAVNSSASSHINIINTTVSDNTTGFMGGGMSFNTTGPVNITNSTITNNYAWWQGGGIQNASSNVTLRNSIIANNTANNGGNPWNIYHNCFPNGSKYSDGGYNLQYSSLNSAASEDCTNSIAYHSAPQLGPLADNGGNTRTRALLIGSPAINIIPVASCPYNNDQRGYPRPLGNKCDIGAYEFNAPPPTISQAFNPTLIAPGNISTLTFTLTNPSSYPLTGVAFSNNLPFGLKVANPPTVTNNCAILGTVTAVAGSSSISVTGLGLSANQVCALSVKVIGTALGNWSSVSSKITSADSLSGQTSNTATIKVAVQTYSASPGGTLHFGVVAVGNTKNLTLNISNMGDPLTTLHIDLGSITFNPPASGEIAFVSATTSYNIAGGNNQNIAIKCTPVAGSPNSISGSFNVTTNDPTRLTVSYNLTCVKTTQTVTQITDNGTNTPGTLSWALQNAGTNGGIIFNLTSGNTITVSAAITVPAGVAIDGGCSGGPGIILDGTGGSGNGLILGGNNYLAGLKIQKFSNTGLDLNSTTGNRMQCVVVTKV